MKGIYKTTLFTTWKAWQVLHKLDRFYVRTEHYMGLAYFWAHEYRHTGLRDATPYTRKLIHTAFLKEGLELGGVSSKHEVIINKYIKNAI